MRPSKLTLVGHDPADKRKSIYRCECGKVFSAFADNVRRGASRSCGCAQQNTIETVLSRIDTAQPGCWEWPSIERTGYPSSVRVRGRRRLAHRAVYELCVGPIPDGLHLDHLCLNPACVRQRIGLEAT